MQSHKAQAPARLDARDVRPIILSKQLCSNGRGIGGGSEEGDLTSRAKLSGVGADFLEYG